VQAIYAVRDLARSLRFYEQAFGWARNERIDYANYVELLPPDGGALGLYARDGFAGTVGAEPSEIPADRVPPAYVYVRVDDVDDAAARVEAAGGRPLSPPRVRSWGERAAWFADPDGNVVAVGGPIQAAPPEPAA
jgi:predicted enzyme related to lactoylglutathione lyase